LIAVFVRSDVQGLAKEQIVNEGSNCNVVGL
jgi:hypothetical protein